jgi:gliding motility-associated-like protein
MKSAEHFLSACFLSCCSVLIAALILSSASSAYAGNPDSKPEGKTKASWNVAHPFEHNVFIENKGQFDGKDNLRGSKIKFGIRIGKQQIYFSPVGLTYRYDEYVSMTEEEREAAMEQKESGASETEKEEAERESTKIKSYYINMKWKGANPDVQLLPAEMVTEYFTYGDVNDKTFKRTFKASASKKIIYRNIYPGIDVEYTFPENKEGIKYAFTVHPGADASQIKMQYSGECNPETDSEGNVSISHAFGDIIDHAPITTYEDKSPVASSFIVDNKTVSFQLENYDNTKTIIIDPWVTGATFAGFNSAYDVEYDLIGNVYVYGGQYPFEEMKYNSSGVLQWTYASALFSSFGCIGACYGDFAVDGQSGSSYLVEGYNGGSGTRVIKVDASGSQVGVFPGNNNFGEMWRVVYNNCTKQAIIAGGGTVATYQACILDTNVSSMTPVNVLSASGPLHDMALLALDNAGNHYMASAQSIVDPSFADNVLIKGPASTLIPLTFSVSDGHAFVEVSSVSYVGGFGSNANGFNGIAVSPNFLYTYDGATLKKWNLTNGTLLDTVVVTATPFAWGGLAVDECDNIYAGVQSSVITYDVNLNATSTIAVTDTVYDLRLGPLNKLYVCGNGFVSELLLASIPCNPITLNVTATGSCTSGMAIATASGGTGPYTYSWAPTGQTTQTATGLTSGTYYVTVTDNSCNPKVQTDSIVVTLGGNLLLNTAQANVTCFGNSTALASVTASSGIGPYTYSWNTVPVQITATATGLPAGNYTVTVVDSTGCSSSQNFIITQPPLLTAAIPSLSNVSCFGATNGTASASAAGGTGAYTYTWNSVPVQYGITATSLAAGNYTVTIHDANGCTATQNVAITQPPLLTAVIPAHTNVSCNGGANGTATASAAGGTGTYTYTWNSVPVQNGTMATSLAAGSYTVTIQDANGCTATQSVVITQPTLLIAAIPSFTNVNCFGGSNGTATATSSGGTPGYTFSWNTVPVQNTANATGLAAGNYTVTVTDNMGCSQTQSVAITQPPILNAAISASANVSCNGGNNGSASVNVAGGTPLYTYSWNTIPPQTTATATGLTSGSYSVTVTDSKGCSQTQNVIITEPSLLTASTNAVAATCSGTANGSVSAAGTGGTFGYTYSWNTVPVQNTQTATGLLAGTYTVTVHDANGCVATQTAVITQPSTLASAITSSANVTCNGGNDGSATVAAGGGSGSYTYLWNPAGGNAAIANNLSAGNYTVTITDANGCTVTSAVAITQPALLTSVINNPVNVNCNGGNNGSAIVTINGGTSGYTYSWAPSGGNTATANNLSAGNYSVTVTDAHGCSTVTAVIITEPNVLTSGINSSVNVKCFGGNDGSAIATAAGGTPGYSYHWSPTGGNSVAANNLSSGIYTVTVTDALGCTNSSTVVITQPVVLAAATTAIGNVLCNGGSDGSATVAANGGIPGYSYVWAPSGGNGITASNLSAGSYSVTVTDANGCSVIRQVAITQPTPVALTLSNPVTICISQSTTISASPSGGTTPYTYTWSNGATTASQSVTPAATINFTVLVADANGCTITQSVTTTVHPPLNVIANATPQICAGSSGTVSAIPGGGDGGPYAYVWSTGQTASSFISSPAASTTYTVTINDGCSPAVQATATIIVNPLPIVGFTPGTAANCIPVSVDFADTANSIPGCSYLWNFGDGTTSTGANPSHVYNTPGQYGVTLTITTPQSCTNTLSLVNVVTAYALPIADFVAPHQIALGDASFIQLTNLSDGSSSWLWDFGDNSGTSTIFNPVCSYTDTGSYTIQLISYSPALCPDTAYRTIKVQGEFAIFIPNSFTPNGDGINDGFIAQGIYIKDYDMWILDRWGAKIYHSTSILKPWNGTYFDNGKLCQNDVYVYKIQARDIFEKMHEFIGHVALVR